MSVNNVPACLIVLKERLQTANEIAKQAKEGGYQETYEYNKELIDHLSKVIEHIYMAFPTYV